MLRNRSLRGQPDRLTTLKRGSIRGLQSIVGAQASPYSSNSSIDGRVSPSPSFATSTHEVGMFFCVDDETSSLLGRVRVQPVFLASRTWFRFQSIAHHYS